MVGFVVVGLTKPLVDIAGQRHIAERTPYSVRARYIGILEMSWAGGLLIGAPVAGWLISQGDWRTPFLVFASLGFVGIGAALAFLPLTDPTEPARNDGRVEVGSRIVRFLAAIVLVGFGHEAILVVLGGWLERDYSLTLIALGGVGTVLGLSDLAGEGAMIGFTDRLGKRRSIVAGCAIAFLGLAGLGASSSFVPAMVALAIVMFGAEFGYISGIPMATELRPDERTRVLGWFYVATGSGRIAADLLAPRLFTDGGMSTVALASSLAFAGAAMLLGFRWRPDRRVGVRDNASS
jgi:predicted MFS family arabinose efflux permease